MPDFIIDSREIKEWRSTITGLLCRLLKDNLIYDDNNNLGVPVVDQGDRRFDNEWEENYGIPILKFSGKAKVMTDKEDTSTRAASVEAAPIDVSKNAGDKNDATTNANSKNAADQELVTKVAATKNTASTRGDCVEAAPINDSKNAGDMNSATANAPMSSNHALAAAKNTITSTKVAVCKTVPPSAIEQELVMEDAATKNSESTRGDCVEAAPIDDSKNAGDTNAATAKEVWKERMEHRKELTQRIKNQKELTKRIKYHQDREGADLEALRQSVNIFIMELYKKGGSIVSPNDTTIAERHDLLEMFRIQKTIPMKKGNWKRIPMKQLDANACMSTVILFSAFICFTRDGEFNSDYRDTCDFIRERMDKAIGLTGQMHSCIKKSIEGEEFLAHINDFTTMFGDKYTSPKRLDHCDIFDIDALDEMLDKFSKNEERDCALLILHAGHIFSFISIAQQSNIICVDTLISAYYVVLEDLDEAKSHLISLVLEKDDLGSNMDIRKLSQIDYTFVKSFTSGKDRLQTLIEGVLAYIDRMPEEESGSKGQKRKQNDDNHWKHVRPLSHSLKSKLGRRHNTSKKKGQVNLVEEP